MQFHSELQANCDYLKYIYIYKGIKVIIEIKVKEFHSFLNLS